MINKETVQTLTEEWLKDNDYFLVDINFAADDRIVIEIDHADGVWIDDYWVSRLRWLSSMQTISVTRLRY